MEMWKEVGVNFSGGLSKEILAGCKLDNLLWRSKDIVEDIRRLIVACVSVPGATAGLLMMMFSSERILAGLTIEFLGASTVENTPAGSVSEDVAVKSSLTVRRVRVFLVVSLEEKLPIKDSSKDPIGNFSCEDVRSSRARTKKSRPTKLSSQS